MKQVFCRRALGAVLGAAAEGGRASSSEDPSIGDTHSLGGLRRSFATLLAPVPSIALFVPLLKGCAVVALVLFAWAVAAVVVVVAIAVPPRANGIVSIAV